MQLARCEGPGASIRAPDQPQPSLLQVVEQVVRNQGVQASEWGDVEGVVTQCGTRVLETVGPAPDTLLDSQTAILLHQPSTQSLVTISVPERSILYTGAAGDAAAAVGPEEL